MGGAGRSSWLGKEAKVNGLFAAQVLPSRRRKKGKVVPASHVGEQAQGELEAFKHVISEEARIKDKLMDELEERCSKAEARIEEVTIEKARVERDLAALRFSQQKQQNRDRELERAEAKMQQLTTALEQERASAGSKDQELARLSHDMTALQRTLEDERRQRDLHIAHLEQTVHQLNGELEGLRAQYQRDVSQLQSTHASAQESAQASEQLADKCEDLEGERDEMRQMMQRLMAENEQLRHANTRMQDRLDDGGASLENTRRRAESQQERIRDQERVIKEAEAARAEAEAKATRLADQLKVSNRKAGFLIKKAESVQQKFIQKEKEANSLANKLEDVNKKYRLAKERLEYVKYTTANGAPGCTTPSSLRSNNEEEDPSGNASGPAPRNSGSANRSRLASKVAGRTVRGSTMGRQEDESPTSHSVVSSQQASVSKRQSQRLADFGPATSADNAKSTPAPLPDPAQAVDSDAPAWMKF